MGVVRHTNQGRAGVFHLEEEGGPPVGELTWREVGERRVAFDHTYVSPGRRGEGLARLLLDRAAAWARAEGLEVVPVCSYVRDAFDAEPDAFGDVDARRPRPGAPASPA